MAPVIPLAEGQFSDAGEMLARAFFHDPLWQHILPDAAVRTRALPLFFAATVEYGRLHGRVETTPALEGVAVWLPPSATEPAEGTEAAEYGPVQSEFDEGAAARFTEMVEHYRRLRQRDVPGPHWYLACLGVDPAWQRRGIGRSLLAPVLDLADRSGVLCYLETENAVNLAFYRDQGFAILTEGRIPGGGPQFWTMRRQPAPG